MLPIVALFAACAAVVAAQAQPQVEYPIFTSAQFVQTMKAVGLNFASVTTSVAKSDFEAAKAQLTRAREQIGITITFWRDRKKEDAIRMQRNVVTKMDELDEALSAEKVEQAAATALVKEVAAGCNACHAVYRDQDPVTKAYRFKPGSVQ